METLKAAGGIVFHKTENGIEYLLVYSEKNNHWGFPKGKMDKGEGELEAALREIKEETGLDNLRVVGDFREDDTYFIQKKQIHKTVTFFLCETLDNAVVIDGKEIKDHKWLPLEEATKLLTFDRSGELLLIADTYLKKNL